MKNKIILMMIFVCLLGISDIFAHGSDLESSAAATPILPLPLEGYGDQEMDSIIEVIKNRITFAPFNLIATLIFLVAVIHTFMARSFTKLSNKYKKEHQARIEKYQGRKDAVSFRAELCHFLGEVEAIFGIWVIPLMGAIFFYYDWQAVLNYINHRVSYIEVVFVVIIMIIASTRPILKLAESAMSFVASLGRHSPAAWWLSIVIIAPLLGSFITEPAAMTIAALLLSKQFYDLKPSPKFAYATLGLLFVNISVGGTVTPFAAPPVLVVARTWGWDIPYMLAHFGVESVTGILLSSSLYFYIFKKEFSKLKVKSQEIKEAYKASHAKDDVKEHPIPLFVTIMHIFFLAWTVWNLHYLPLIIGGFLFFLAFTQITLHHQFMLRIRNPLLVGFFLAGLVTHGGLQQWWLQPVLNSLSEVPLFIGATVLTAFNDNAAITYLASQVPEFMNNPQIQNAVVSGAITGGGLTVIANAPNPAGQSILAHYFEDGVSPLKLFLGALTPTLILATIYLTANQLV